MTEKSLSNRSEPDIFIGISGANGCFRKQTFFGILTHDLIKSHIRDRSRHHDCCCASFYNDALFYMGKALVQGARGRLQASRSPRKIGGTYLVNQVRRLIAGVFPSSRFLPFDSKELECPRKSSRLYPAYSL